jgi:ATP-grasp domain, R2K clade family 2
MRALIQKRESEFSSVNTCSAFLGLRERGYKIEFFEIKDFDNTVLDAHTLVVGGVPIIQRAFSRLGLEPPNLESIPTSLHEFAKRKLWIATIAEVRSQIDRGNSIFVKPMAGELKSFAGHVAANYADLTITAGLPEHQVVSCSEPVRMTSEYRTYVTHGKAIGCKHYWGDFRTYPDFSVIEKAITAYKDCPAGYAIDFAVTDEGETVLIEVNDGFALGSYGLHPLLYSGLLEARWEELTLRLRNDN